MSVSPQVKLSLIVTGHNWDSIHDHLQPAELHFVFKWNITLYNIVYNYLYLQWIISMYMLHIPVVFIHVFQVRKVMAQ